MGMEAPELELQVPGMGSEVWGWRQELGMERGWGWRDQGWGSGNGDRAGERDRGHVQGDRDTHGSGDGAGDPPVPQFPPMKELFQPLFLPPPSFFLNFITPPSFPLPFRFPPSLFSPPGPVGASGALSQP